MIVEQAMNDRFLQIELVSVEKADSIKLITGSNTIAGVRVGRIVGGANKDKHILFSSYNILQAATAYENLYFVEAQHVIAYVAPSPGENFVPLVEFDLSTQGSTWINK